MTFLASRRLKSNEDGENPSASASKKVREISKMHHFYAQKSSSTFKQDNTTIDFPPFLAQREREKGSPKQCYCQLCPDSPSDGTLENKENFGIDSPPKKKPNPLSKEKRERYLSWDDYFMTVAFLSSQRSKDPNKQVGAVIASPRFGGVRYFGCEVPTHLANSWRIGTAWQVVGQTELCPVGLVRGRVVQDTIVCGLSLALLRLVLPGLIQACTPKSH